MSDFVAIETQEQLDKVIGERIRRAEQKAAEKYSDYDAVKTQNGELTQQIADLQAELSKQTETINGNQTVVDELRAKVQSYEIGSVKTKVALELGLPYQIAGRLTGETEEDIRKDAEAMVALIGKNQPVAPLGSPEPTAKTSLDKEAVAKRQLKELLNRDL